MEVGEAMWRTYHEGTGGIVESFEEKFGVGGADLVGGGGHEDGGGW